MKMIVQHLLSTSTDPCRPCYNFWIIFTTSIATRCDYICEFPSRVYEQLLHLGSRTLLCIEIYQHLIYPHQHLE